MGLFCPWCRRRARLSCWPDQKLLRLRVWLITVLPQRRSGRDRCPLERTGCWLSIKIVTSSSASTPIRTARHSTSARRRRRSETRSSPACQNRPKGIDHYRRAATVDQEPSHAQPPQNGPVADLKSFRTERLSPRERGLDVAWRDHIASAGQHK